MLVDLFATQALYQTFSTNQQNRPWAFNILFYKFKQTIKKWFHIVQKMTFRWVNINVITEGIQTNKFLWRIHSDEDLSYAKDIRGKIAVTRSFSSPTYPCPRSLPPNARVVLWVYMRPYSAALKVFFVTKTRSQQWLLANWKY